MADNGQADREAQRFVKSGEREGSRDGIASKETMGSTSYVTIIFNTNTQIANSHKVSTKSDVILVIQEPYMQQIVSGKKTYEFRKYRLEQSVKRIWFYSTAPQSSIDYICEILPAKTRSPGDLPLAEDGIGNREFNTRHKDWEGYDFAYKILSVYKIKNPITLNDLKDNHGMSSAPRGLIYAPSSLLECVEWQNQSKLI
jgi:predicted transcriptional regulator